MVGFFSRGRKQEYHGFSKYQDELRHSGSGGMVAGLPNPSHNRSQSFSNGAGQAAAAALRMHRAAGSQPSPAQRQSYHPQQYHIQQSARAPKRTQSLSSVNRSNSLRSYTYHPKGSYTPGSAQVPTASVSSRSNSLLARPTITPVHEETQYEEVEEVEEVVTTKTIKIVDSQGRTHSIKTTTVRTLPDGSKSIETTTKNISRSNSRANSRANSLNSANLRANSMLSTENPVNLTKIEEDLHDFDYNYEMDSRMEPQVRLNVSKEHERAVTDNAAILAEKNVEAPAVKPLRSILKGSHSNSEDNEDSQFAEAVEEPKKTSEAHPYKSIPSEALQAPKFKVPTSPPINPKSPTKRHSPHREDVLSSASSSIKFDDRVETIPIYNKNKSNALGKAFAPRKEAPKKKPPSDADFYAAAMKAAYKKVYGEDQPQEQTSPISNGGHIEPSSPEQQASPTQYQPPSSAKSGNRTFSISSNISSLIDNRRSKQKTSQDKALEEVGGVDSSFHYGNHHRDFVKHSLREPLPKSSTRKERSRDEKKLLKEAQAEKDLAEKKARKEAKAQQKLLKKEKKKVPEKEREKKSTENKNFLSLFGRRKSSVPGVHDTEASFAPLDAPAQAETEVSDNRELRPDLIIPHQDVPSSDLAPEHINIPAEVKQTTNLSKTVEPHTPITDEKGFDRAHHNYVANVGYVPLSNQQEKLPYNGPVNDSFATSRYSDDEPIIHENTRPQESKLSPIHQLKESDYTNTTASSPYLSASSPNEYEQARDHSDAVEDRIPVPRLSDVDTPQDFYTDSEEEDTEEQELGAHIDRSGMENAILGRSGSPLATANGGSEKVIIPDSLPEHQPDQVKNSNYVILNKSEIEPDTDIQEEYDVAAAYIEGDGYKQSVSEVNIAGVPNVSYKQGLRDSAHEDKNILEEPSRTLDPEIIVSEGYSREVSNPLKPSLESSEARPIIAAAEASKHQRPKIDDGYDDSVVNLPSVVAKPVNSVENAQHNHSPRQLDEPEFIPGTSAPLSPNRIPAVAANTTAPVPLDPSSTESVSGRVPGSTESPGDDKSTVPTLASQNSEQRTNSTVATDHRLPVTHETPGHTYEEEVASLPKKSNKSKKPNKIKERIFKYFINSYDK